MLIFSFAPAVDWTAIGALAALFTVVAFLAGLVAQRVNRMRNNHKDEQTTDERVITALFGKNAMPPYPKIEGLVVAHETLSKFVLEIDGRVTAIEETLGSVTSKIDKLVERTEENGGGSIKDQLNTIEAYILQEQKKNKGGP